jgi:hypothetical protein
MAINYLEAATRYSDDSFQGRAKAAASDYANLTVINEAESQGDRALASAILAGNEIDEAALIRLVAVTEPEPAGDIDLDDVALFNAVKKAWPTIASARGYAPAQTAPTVVVNPLGG